MTVQRFVISDKSTGLWIASIYAERYEQSYDPRCVNFFRGSEVIGQVDPTLVTFGDSGGRMEAKHER